MCLKINIFIILDYVHCRYAEVLALNAVYINIDHIISTCTLMVYLFVYAKRKKERKKRKDKQPHLHPHPKTKKPRIFFQLNKSHAIFLYLYLERKEFKLTWLNFEIHDSFNK